jgi:TolA-binding protein
MRGVDIHPEELIDKLAEGSLTHAERKRLNVHLGQCASCRFEIGVRADLAEDAPVLLVRPQLTFAGGAQKGQALESPDEPLAPQVSPSVRARSRHRWPLSLLVAALVLCAGGAMAAISGAVSSDWLPWSAEPKPAASSVDISDTKAGLRMKRAVSKPTSLLPPATESTASSVAPSTPVGSAAAGPVAAEPAAVGSVAVALPASVVAAPTASPVRQRRAEVALAAPENARAAALAEGGSAEVSTRVEPAAALFADANRARRDGNVDRAVGLYRALQARYPNSSEAGLSRALLAQLLLDRGNPEAALAGFDRYLAEDSPILSAEALVGRARALEQMGKPTQAAAAWRQVQSRFPGSVHARLAATRLAALGMR